MNRRTVESTDGELIARSVAGVSGRCRMVKHDVAGLRGSGPNGEVDFHDLWEEGPDGQWISKHPERITEDRTHKNKMLCRGLSYLMYTAVQYQTGTVASKQPTDITHYPDRNPFLAFILIGDDSATPVRPGDAKVVWHESDGEFDDKIPAGSGSAIYGRRGVLLATTTGIFKRVQIRYVSTSPYDEQEITLFAQANDPAVETGDNGLDNFVAKGYGFAYGLACGHNEASSQLAIRSILGLQPTLQGEREREYFHENYVYSASGGASEGDGSVTALHKYAPTEDVGTYGEGYVSSYDPADSVIATYASVNLNFTAGTKRIQVTGASFDTLTSDKERKTLTVSGTVNNNKDFTIKRVVDADEVEVFETVVTEGPVSATAVLKTRNTGDKCFDGRVENEGLFKKNTYDDDSKGDIIQGEKWMSQDADIDHHIGRIWASAKTVRKVRIVLPAGSNRDYCPNKFYLQTLNQYHEGTTDPPWPEYNNDWTTRVDKSAGGEASNIFSGEEYGYEYDLGADYSTQGIRLSVMRAEVTTGKAEIAEIYIRGDLNTIDIAAPDNILKYSLDGGSTWKTKTIAPTSMTTGMEDIADAINSAIYGFGAEAVVTSFGYLLLRGTMAGDNSTFEVESEGSGSTINSDIGLPSAGADDTGETQPFTKAPENAVTFIYTSKLSGNLAKPV